MQLNRLLRPDKPWLHLLVAPEEKAYELSLALAQSAPPCQVASRVIRGRKAQSKASLLDESAAALQFPPYFGENWDAYNDSLTDLEWLPAEAYALWVTNAPLLLAKEPAEELHQALQIWDNAAQEWGKPVSGEWARPAKAFHVIFQCAPEEEAKLRARLQGAKYSFDVLP
jgi:Barstar (barnase inhibitor)